ncbi:hypothetical protein N7478_008902 [Penicillium angulare]|uniref:uncharacterized protein n=1 Tax=Penicillium angulare TaxID=116970 RepID=UPI00254077C9|nr:uncharacterized protein N7478_008902 [Penicillium angulare]KAJ5273777.1 hypothetical protein N7478_008902 [Penicillium angulare]
MKFLMASALLAASSTLAAPTTANLKRDNFISITDFYANAGPNSPGAFMHFVVTDPNYPNDTPTECNLIWYVPYVSKLKPLYFDLNKEEKINNIILYYRTYGQSPNQNARCNDSEYYIKFPQGPVDFNLFTLQLERVNGSIPENGQILLSSNANGGAPGTKWICENNPKPNIEISCSYDGTLQLSV